MIADPAGRQILGGGGALAVDVKALGKELRRLWEETTHAPDAGGGPVITRACTRNLIAIASNAAEAERATRMLAAVAGLHPTRAFVIEASAEGDPARLEAHLQALCSIRGAGRHVCCEQIAMTVGPLARRRAAGTIVPLLVPDLPVFVWVLGTPAWDDELLVRLLEVADRVVVDTRGAHDPVALLGALDGSARDDRWAPGDFEWSRLAPWREAVASLFDEPSTAALPARIERVLVRYGAGGSRIGAALLAGWALDRVQSARDRAETGFALRAADGDGVGEDAPATAELVAVPGRAPGEICGAELHARVPRARCAVVASEDEAALSASVDLQDACPLPARHPWARLADESLLEDQLDMPGVWPVYERALARAATLLAGVAPDGG
jgi:glucose-6-phosphate dehydrogenase assembly protein OpcA